MASSGRRDLRDQAEVRKVPRVIKEHRDLKEILVPRDRRGARARKDQSAFRAVTGLRARWERRVPRV